MEHFNLTKEQKDTLTNLYTYNCDIDEVLGYFKSIRPKAYARVLKRNALSRGIHNKDEWNALTCDGTADDVLLDTFNEILERCGIDIQ